ncbi:hypothetical protein AXF42_Ash018421 [Apostasia shenzhenica]|uniref:Flavin mononucleotide hydrolase 1, chloroplatic n=1 Tax=Apostasia shenzhenica TaxID=1088818 RepID=A0A2I0BEA6_9ASPA|nr:hypothetical protein AXF42_Ash018421 [Apostasia shenzhenica]
MAAIFRPGAAVFPHYRPNPAASGPPPAMAGVGGCSTLRSRKLPVLLFDVMDTIVRDPFYHDIPAFFKYCEELLLLFSVIISLISSLIFPLTELAQIFFKDGRPFDLEGLKDCMRRGYSFVDGIEELLHMLKENNYELHAFTNYPVWYMMIEEKLKLSKYLSWTFCSCKIGKRKPAPDSYTEVLHRLGIEPTSCLFIDDRQKNVEAAKDAGMIGIHFRDADSLKQDLSSLGIELAVLT